MTFKEIKGDLFTAPEDYYFAHCISSDFAMGAGIAPQFTEHFNTKNDLVSNYPNFRDWFVSQTAPGYCLKIGRVYNLITKVNVWDKPTIESLDCALGYLVQLMQRDGITKLAIPRIGCGLDGLEWKTVSTLIKDKFADTDIEIKVYTLDEE